MRNKLVACIFLKDCKAIKGFDSDEVISDSPVELAVSFSKACVDGIIVWNMSADASCEANLDCIKEICSVSKVPVFCCGNIRCAEDIRKLVDAGCKMVGLNYSKDFNIALTNEASTKFGKNKIFVVIKDKKEFNNNKELIEKCASLIVALNDVCVQNIEPSDNYECILFNNNHDINRILKVLDMPFVNGVCGECVEANLDSLYDIRIQKGLSFPKFTDLKLNSDGLIPVIVQDYKSNDVLMLAYMNELAYEDTLRTRVMNYYSRSRKQQWLKGETSGHFQYVKALYYDCDADTLLAKVEQIGAACHTGKRSCFHNEIVNYE